LTKTFTKKYSENVGTNTITKLSMGKNVAANAYQDKQNFILTQIEEMESQGYYLNIIGKCGGNAYYVRFEQSEQKGESVSLSLPTAICQAALSTIEEKLR
jgi:hypothetical protein